MIEHQPAAIAVSDSGRVPVAGDGTILRGLAVKGSLPTSRGRGRARHRSCSIARPAERRAVAGARARRCCAARIEDVQRRSDDGYVAELRDGPELIFGAATRLRAKWAAAARVLADLEARGATYVDLRIPSRPAVGGLAATTLTPVAPAGPELPATPAAQARVTPERAQSAAPNVASRRTRRRPADHSAGAHDHARRPSRRPPQPPADPLTAGTGGGATAAP